MNVPAAALRDTAVEAAIGAVIAAGSVASERGWTPATSGNFSVRIDRDRIAITRSGVDKGALKASDVLIQSLDRPPIARIVRRSRPARAAISRGP